MKDKNRQDNFETQDENPPMVDHIEDLGAYDYQKSYFKTQKGKAARRRAEKAYDKRDPNKRRKQKRDYMRRKRAKDPDYGKN